MNSGNIFSITDSMVFFEAFKEACCAATYWPIAMLATVAGDTPRASETKAKRSLISGRRRTDKVKSRSCFGSETAIFNS